MDDLAISARQAIDEWYTGKTNDPSKIIMYAENLLAERNTVLSNIKAEAIQTIMAKEEIARLRTLIHSTAVVVDELVAWVNTDTIGCVEVMERGENTLRQLRKEVEGEAAPGIRKLDIEDSGKPGWQP